MHAVGCHTGRAGGRLVLGLEPCHLVGHFPTGNPSYPLPPGVRSVCLSLGSVLWSVPALTYLAHAPVAVAVPGVGWPEAPPHPHLGLLLTPA